MPHDSARRDFTVSRLAAWILLLSCASPQAARGDALVQPWEELDRSLAQIHGFPNALFHVTAVVTTPPIVYGADREVQDFFQEHDPLSNAFGHAMLWVGGCP